MPFTVRDIFCFVHGIVQNNRLFKQYYDMKDISPIKYNEYMMKTTHLI